MRKTKKFASLLTAVAMAASLAVMPVAQADDIVYNTVFDMSTDTVTNYNDTDFNSLTSNEDSIWQGWSSSWGGSNVDNGLNVNLKSVPENIIQFYGSNGSGSLYTPGYAQGKSFQVTLTANKNESYTDVMIVDADKKQLSAFRWAGDGWWVDNGGLDFSSFGTMPTYVTTLAGGVNVGAPSASPLTITVVNNSDDTYTVTYSAVTEQALTFSGQANGFGGFHVRTPGRNPWYQCDALGNLTVAEEYAGSTVDVTFDYNYDGNADSAEGDPEATVVATVPGSAPDAPANPTREGYAFTGWFTDAACQYVADVTVAVDAATTYYAGWEEQVAVTYNYNYEGAPDATVVLVDKNAAVAAPANPTREGYAFTDWYSEADCVNTADVTAAVTEATTYYAGWQKQWVVTFVYGNGAADTTVYVDADATVAAPANPVRPGYAFEGWDYNFETPVTADTTITAQWSDAYTKLSYAKTMSTGNIGEGVFIDNVNFQKLKAIGLNAGAANTNKNRNCFVAFGIFEADTALDAETVEIGSVTNEIAWCETYKNANSAGWAPIDAVGEAYLSETEWTFSHWLGHQGDAKTLQANKDTDELKGLVVKLTNVNNGSYGIMNRVDLYFENCTATTVVGDTTTENVTVAYGSVPELSVPVGTVVTWYTTETFDEGTEVTAVTKDGMTLYAKTDVTPATGSCAQAELDLIGAMEGVTVDGNVLTDAADGVSYTVWEVLINSNGTGANAFTATANYGESKQAQKTFNLASALEGGLSGQYLMVINRTDITSIDIDVE